MYCALVFTSGIQRCDLRAANVVLMFTHNVMKVRTIPLQNRINLEYNLILVDGLIASESQLCLRRKCLSANFVLANVNAKAADINKCDEKN